MESTTGYALTIKGGYYNSQGEIVDGLIDAKFFVSPEEAMKFRKKHDPIHRVDKAQLLQVVMLVELRDELVEDDRSSEGWDDE